MGAPELIIVLIIVLVVFGSSRLPKLAKSLGETKKEIDKMRPKDDEGTGPPSTDPNQDPKA